MLYKKDINGSIEKIVFKHIGIPEDEYGLCWKISIKKSA